MTLRALYVDFNAYFASVEQQLQPTWRGRPLAVVPMLADSTCCIAASYEARAFGIKTGMLVREARQRCPDLVLVAARPALYVAWHHKLVALVESCTHVNEVRSIDEMWCALTGRDQQRERAVQLAQLIKHTIATQGGHYLRSSIGIAPNIYLAKVASNLQKPDGLSVIEEHDLPQVLYALKLRDLNGIGARMEARLQACGIETVQQLCEATPEQLRVAWRGVGGQLMYDRLRGRFDVPGQSPRSSVGHSHVLAPQWRDEAGAWAVANRLLQKAAMRLRSYQLVASRLYLSLKFRNRQGQRAAWSEEVCLDATAETLTLLKALQHAWRHYPRRARGSRGSPPYDMQPFFIAVTLLQLSAAADCTRSWLDEPGQEKLDQTLDHLNLKYGKGTVYFGGAHNALQAAPMRIAFSHIPNLDLESDRALD
jgi:DNA polymerase-4